MNLIAEYAQKLCKTEFSEEQGMDNFMSFWNEITVCITIFHDKYQKILPVITLLCDWSPKLEDSVSAPGLNN